MQLCCLITRIKELCYQLLYYYSNSYSSSRFANLYLQGSLASAYSNLLG
jgi:hypothetical protein